MGTVKGQFIYAHIIVEPLDFGSNRISVVCKQELEGELGHLSNSRIVSDPNLSRVVRQIALHCNLAAIIFSKSKLAKVDPYASNWIETHQAVQGEGAEGSAGGGDVWPDS